MYVYKIKNKERFPQQKFDINIVENYLLGKLFFS